MPESHWHEHRADAFAAVDISARAAFMADDAGDVRKGQGSTHLDKGTFAERFFDPAFDAAMGLLDVTQKPVDARRRMSGCAGRPTPA